MAISCAVCDESLPDAAPQCGTCGYPVALAEDARRALSEPDPVARPPERAPLAPRGPLRASTAADSQAELCRRLALELTENRRLLQRLGGDAPALASEMSQAALTQADGRVGEALALLRNAHSHVILQTSELFERRVEELERRQRSLAQDGVGVAVKGDVDRMRTEFDAGRREEGLQMLFDTDQRLGRVESDWNGLKGLLQQIETLREAASQAGRDLPTVDEDLRQVREILSRPSVGGEGLDVAAQTAARALMMLHESLPPVLEQELAKHGEVLEQFGADHEESRRAKALHAEASRHLRRGRLADASTRLRELRSALRELGSRPPPPPVAVVTTPTEPEPVPSPVAGPESPAPPAPANGGASNESLGRLLLKARGLAARVRTLPPESEVAFEAAAEIRRATELLRGRKLDEAEMTLTRLMRTLDAEHPAEV